MRSAFNNEKHCSLFNKVILHNYLKFWTYHVSNIESDIWDQNDIIFCAY